MTNRSAGPGRPLKVLGRMIVLFVAIAAAGCGLLGEFEDQVATDIRDNPVIVQHIGEIQTIETDWTATGNAPGDDVFVFRISGTKGDGVLTAECITVNADSEDVVSGSLELPSGETVDLFE